jgi:hypothetical protein
MSIKKKLCIISEILPKSTTSKTIICKGTDIYNKKIYFKISLFDSKQTNNSLYYEYTTYKHLMNISKTDETVNEYFIKYYSLLSGICVLNDFKQRIIISPENEQLFNNRVIELMALNYNYDTQSLNNINLLILTTYDYNTSYLESYIYTNFTDSIISNVVNYKKFTITFINILLILLNGIFLLNKYNINHNDMHFNNIQINDIPTKYNCIDTFGKKYILNSNVNIKIFDFDRAYMSANTNNSILNQLIKNGLGINKFIKHRDYYVFVQQLFNLEYETSTHPSYTILYKFLNNLLNNIIKPPYHINILRSNMELIKKNKAKNIYSYNVHETASCYRPELQLPPIIDHLQDQDLELGFGQGPIQGPMQGPIQGPIQGPMQGEMQGEMQQPMQGQMQQPMQQPPQGNEPLFALFECDLDDEKKMNKVFGWVIHLKQYMENYINELVFDNKINYDIQTIEEYTYKMKYIKYKNKYLKKINHYGNI